MPDFSEYASEVAVDLKSYFEKDDKETTGTATFKKPSEEIKKVDL